jgi:hypothetical protein
VSAKTGENVMGMFQAICSKLLEIKNDDTVPNIEVMQSKLVTNVSVEKEKGRAVTKNDKAVYV